MSTRVAELYAELTLRDDSLNDGLDRSRGNLQQFGTAADAAAAQAQRAAERAATSYKNLQKETERMARAAETQASKAVNSADRVRVVEERLADAIRDHGEASDQARAAEQQLDTARRDALRTANNAERANDLYRISLRRTEEAQQRAAATARDLRQDVDRAGDAMRDAVPDEASVNRFSAALERVGGAASQVGEQAGGAMGNDFVGSFSGRISGLASKAGPIGAALAGVAVLGVAAGALVAQSLQEGMQREAATDSLQAQLGTTPEIAARIGRAAADAYMGNFGESVEANMDSIRAAIQSGLLTGEESQPVMQKTVEQLDTVSTVLRTEVSDSVRAVSALMTNGLAKDSAHAFDLITKAGQGSANKADDLVDSVSEYSSGWKNAGISAELALALIEQSTDNGADSSDRAADSLREFGRRVTEEGDTIIESIDNIGLSGRDMYDAFKRGGPDAEAAFDQVFDKIRSIEDPVARNNAAMSLLGDTAGDFIGTLAQWDPSNALRSFGDVSGAAQEASDTIGSGAASSAETLRRTWEEATMGVKLALADAFGPAASDMTSKLLENKDELVAFFADILSACLMFGEGVAMTASGVLRGWAMMADGVAQAMSLMTDAIGVGANMLGSLVSAIPGMEGIGEKISGVGDAAMGMSERIRDSADTARSMADTLDETVLPVLSTMREGVDSAGDSARLAAQGMDILTGSVVSIPDEASVIISDNSPEAKARLEDLGFSVETLPDGNVSVTAQTEDAQQRLNDFVAANDRKNFKMYVDLEQRRVGYWQSQGVSAADAPAMQGPVPVSQPGDGRGTGGTFADGGYLPDEATVRDGAGDGVVQKVRWAEGETKREYFIPTAPSKKRRSTSLLVQAAGELGLGVYKMNDGGVLGSLENAAAGSGLQLTSGYRAGDSGYHGSGMAGDFSNGSGNTDEMLAFANKMADQYKSQLAELIYDDPRFGRQIKNGEFVDDSFYAGAGDHTNHVHVAAKEPLASQTVDPAAAQQASAVDPNSKQGIANRIIAEGKRRGMSDREIKSAVMAGLAESDLQDLDYGDRDSDGVLQQRPSQGWGPTTETVEQDVNQYYDALQKVQGRENMTEAQMAQAVQRSAFSDGSNYQARSDEADQYLAGFSGASNSTAGTDAPSSADPAATTATGGVQDVRVTNWPEGLGAVEKTPEEERQPRARVLANFYANGGFEDQSPQIANTGSGIRVWAEPQAGPWEGYVPGDPAKRGRALEVWKQIGRRLGVKQFADGGFYGYSGPDTEDVMAPKNLYDALALGVGTAFTLASGASNLLGMLESGTIDLSKLAPSFDTSSNSIPGLDKAFQAFSKQLEEIAATLQKGGMIDARIDVDTNTGAAGLSLTKSGVA